MRHSYHSAMDEKKSFLTITLNLNEPVEIGDFASHFAGLGAEFDRFISKEHPSLRGRARIYVREVRKGSIIADIVPVITDIVGAMDSALIVGGFASLFSKRVRKFISGGFLPNAKKPELKNIHDSIQAVAQDRDGDIEMAENHFENGVIKSQTVFRMSSNEARLARDTIERQKAELDLETHADHSRVLMVFERPSSTSKNVGSSTGERVVIEQISTKPKSLIYGSDLAEERIKHEILNSNDNIFKLGFVCDVNVALRGGRVVGYSVIEVHQVIDLPDN